jgi:hypothetical protein
MKKPIILELRGTGVLLRACSIENENLQTLENLAATYGEELPTAWFDPAFRWRKKVRTLLETVSVVSESRGLLIDGRSFLEIRQPRKRRRKFTMSELLSTNQLFPLVRSSTFSAPSLTNGTKIVLEITHGIGCMGRFETEVLNLAELELAVFKLPSQKHEAALLMNHSGIVMECLKDDFVVRRNELFRL